MVGPLDDQKFFAFHRLTATPQRGKIEMDPHPGQFCARRESARAVAL
jgi:hypothetical protein